MFLTNNLLFTILDFYLKIILIGNNGQINASYLGTDIFTLKPATSTFILWHSVRC
jgi:hypothetical protein